MKRIKVRVVQLDADSKIIQIMEQENLASEPNLHAFLRRAHVKRCVADALLNGGSVKIEVAR